MARSVQICGLLFAAETRRKGIACQMPFCPRQFIHDCVSQSRRSLIWLGSTIPTVVGREAAAATSLPKHRQETEIGSDLKGKSACRRHFTR
jgi:hypothetical protein